VHAERHAGWFSQQSLRSWDGLHPSHLYCAPSGEITFAMRNHADSVSVCISQNKTTILFIIIHFGSITPFDFYQDYAIPSAALRTTPYRIGIIWYSFSTDMRSLRDR
jgi:hypothetical protein